MKRKKMPQFVHKRCGRDHSNSKLKKMGVSYKLQLLLLKQELEHDEIFEDMWEARENERLPYVKKDVS